METQKKQVLEYLDKKGISVNFEVPKNPEFGDFCFATFAMAKSQKKNPADLANELSQELAKQFHAMKITCTGPYVNFKVSRVELGKEVMELIFSDAFTFENKSKIKSSKKIVIDYSSPNIAKPFGIGHLRSTVIGMCINRIYSYLGYQVIGVNHLGDWGTQFGKLIVAYKKWGNEEELNKDPIKFLLSIYVKFHEEAQKDKSLDDEARAAFKKLEDGDKDAQALWARFIELSLKEFNKIYELLNVKFDSFSGESFYNNMLDSTIESIKQKGITEISEGALIVNLEKYNMPPCLLKKSDGATLYATRDLAALFFRVKTYNPEKIIYVVGSEQKLHFKQFFKVASLVDEKLDGIPIHVDFGLYRFEDAKMSTRKGNVIFMEDVLNKSMDLAEKIIMEKNPNLPNKKEVAKKVGIGAVIFADLSTDRVKDVVFDWSRIISFEGETGPYIQYSFVRINSIIDKAGKHKGPINYELLSSDKEGDLIKQLSLFDETIKRVAEEYKPHYLARYLLDLSSHFNEFYHACPVLNAENEELKNARLALICATAIVLKIGLNLLGIDAPQKM